MNSENDPFQHLEARLEAHEHLLRHLIVTVLARSEDPVEALDGFRRRIAAPLRRRPAEDAASGDPDFSNIQILEIVDWISRGVGEDIHHAVSQIAGRRR